MMVLRLVLYRRLHRVRRSLGRVVLAVAVGLAWWHGGYYAQARWAFAAAGLAALPAARLRGALRDPVAAGLAVAAVANVAAAMRAGSGGAAAAAACALPVVYLVSRDAESRWAASLVAAVVTATAAAGLASLALQRTPMAERIGGIWRAGGTFEYPPALALACVCGLACVAGLAASGAIGRPAAVVSGGVMVAALALTYDRAGAVAALAAGVVLVMRARAGRRAAAVVAVAVAASAVALLLARPPLHALAVHLRHGTISSRSDAWSDAVRAFRHRPLLGYGPGGFARSYTSFPADPTRVGRAHDAVLDQAVEAGVLAAAGMAVALVAGAVRGLRGLRGRDPLAGAWAVVALCATASALYDFTWSYPPLAAIGVVAFGQLRSCLSTAASGR